jgi:ankyrin repeat protein
MVDICAPLHCAADYGQFGAIRWLVDGMNADVHAKDNVGKLALHYAAENGHLDIAKWLVDEKDADIQARANDEKTCLHYAVPGREHRDDRIAG